MLKFKTIECAMMQKMPPLANTIKTKHTAETAILCLIRVCVLLNGFHAKKSLMLMAMNFSLQSPSPSLYLSFSVLVVRFYEC